MFINCPHCGALVATEPATDLPPARCPRCAVTLREVDSHAAEAAAHPLAPTGTGEMVHSPTAALAEAIAATNAPPANDAADDADSSNAGTIATPSAPTNVDPTRDDVPASTVAVPEADTQGERASLAADAAPSIDYAAESAPDATAPPASPMPAAVPAPARRDKPAPSFARTRAPVATTNARRRWTLPSLIAGLSLLLALQWILADRARLAADADWRPFVTQLCATLRCELPPWREPSAFALLERDVRPHPDVPSALRVTATFRNDARWPQPWPEVVLTLSDVDGRAIGARAFDAGEYLGTKPAQNELSSGQTATIRMDILEPAPHVVAFAFDFR